MTTSTVLGSLFIATIAIVFTLKYIKPWSTSLFIFGRVKKIIIYPIKSLPGIEIDEVTVTPRGLQYNQLMDRSWVLVDEKNVFITQRKYPTLALLKCFIEYNKIIIKKPNGQKLIVEKIPAEGKSLIKLRIWDDYLYGIDVGQEASEYFQEFLNVKDIKLIQFSFNNIFRNSIVHKHLRDPTSKIIFQDESPCMIMNSSSIDDLNSRIEEKVSYRNFRPSILITGPKYKEDFCAILEINGVKFKRLERCGRCKLTTVNPDNAQFMKEPLNTLNTYRQPKNKLEKYKYGASPYLGVHYVPLNNGKIRIKDDIWSAYKPI